VRAQAAASIAADAHVYFRQLFSGVEPDIALIVADDFDLGGTRCPRPRRWVG
jgi:hypothetical protein